MQLLKTALAVGSLASMAVGLPHESHASYAQSAASKTGHSWATHAASSAYPPKASSTKAVLSQSASASNVTSSSGGNSTSAGDGSLGIPSGLLTSKAGISFGFLPDSGNSENMAEINKALGGKQAATYGWYSQITGTTYDDSQLTEVMNDVKQSGAVFIPAVMPTKVKFSQIDSDLAGQIAASMKKFTDEGIEVWLRFAHEVNYYVTDGTYAGGTSQEFVQAWQNVATACKSNSKVKMFWSPNSASSSSIQPWFPGAEYVDIVGIDIYPKAGSQFSDVYGDFYNAFAKPNNLPFAIGETGSGSSATNDKEAWVTQLTNADYSDFPLYKAATWFEYNKEEDFHVVLDVPSSTVQETLSNFQ